MVGTLKLTRAQLSSFLNGNHDLIKQFESLFTTVDAIAPDFVDEVLIAAGIADTKAQQSLDDLERVKQALALVALAPQRDLAIKNQEVLTWLSM